MVSGPVAAMASEWRLRSSPCSEFRSFESASLTRSGRNIMSMQLVVSGSTGQRQHVNDGERLPLFIQAEPLLTLLYRQSFLAGYPPSVKLLW